ncbi:MULTISPECIES: AAA family ATPase [Streptomyces]|uniref:AAA family ATPase n=1 Tax=Streptomyces edwardsiae TaxID=3075527 RepID=A0ABU2QE08_9ACTN|nr:MULTISPECIES: AAA family ATPase [unclassified Streptomyces]MDT0402686.1 AAA family ATPase [Streptomyces sp. DSM 41635]
MSRRLRRITVSGYKSIDQVELALGPVTMLVGPNGAGKSNFIGAVELLGFIADGDLGEAVGRLGGAAALLHDVAKGAAGIGLRVEADDGALVNAYEAKLVPSHRGELVFSREVVEFHDTGRFEKPMREEIGRGHRESRLAETAERTPFESIVGVARHTLEILRGCRVYHFHDTTPGAPVKQPGYATDTENLHPDARNLAAFLMRLREEHPADYQQIVRTVRSVAPFFRDFVLTEDAAGRVLLRWKQSGSDTVFPADALSDGSLRFICLAVLLLQPRPPALLVLDEPELGLHPFAITVLAELFRSASAHSQILAATQSVTLVDQFELDELVVAERVNGSTRLDRPDREALGAWLGDYSLGDLWLKNLLGGRPRPERKR